MIDTCPSRTRPPRLGILADKFPARRPADSHLAAIELLGWLGYDCHRRRSRDRPDRGLQVIFAGQYRDFIESQPKWERFLHEFQPPRVLQERDQLRELALRSANLRRRLRDGPLAPLRLAFFGPTGTGKSKLFSSLIGKQLSASSYHRPFTRHSVYYVHDDWQALVAALPGEVVLHTDPAWRGVILVDTPDFDSVELANRDEADRVFLESDGFFFVTDALKYADASTWDYLARLRRSRKPFVIILNKVNSEAIPASFDARFRETFAAKSTESLPYQKVMIPELPIRDDALIDDPGIGQLAEQAKKLVGPYPADESVARFQGELAELFDQVDVILTEVRTRREQIDELQSRLRKRHAESLERLEERLAAGLEPAVRDEVYQRVMTRLDSIDLLRYPRKIMAMPIQGLRSWWQSWRRGDQPAVETSVDRVVDPVTSETFHMLESELIRFADESRLDIMQQPGLQELIPRDTFRRLRMDHEEVQELYRRQHGEFRDWVETHARSTAAEITGENKLKFMLSQVLFHTVLITAQVKTGGGLTLLEAGLDGVISPFVAKTVSIAIGNEKVKQFEAQAHERHQACLATVLDTGRQRFADFLTEASAGLDELQTVLAEIAAYRPQVPSLVRHFAEDAKTGTANDSTEAQDA